MNETKNMIEQLTECINSMKKLMSLPAMKGLQNHPDFLRVKKNLLEIDIIPKSLTNILANESQKNESVREIGKLQIKYNDLYKESSLLSDQKYNLENKLNTINIKNKELEFVNKNLLKKFNELNIGDDPEKIEKISEEIEKIKEKGHKKTVRAAQKIEKEIANLQLEKIDQEFHEIKELLNGCVCIKCQDAHHRVAIKIDQIQYSVIKCNYELAAVRAELHGMEKIYDKIFNKKHVLNNIVRKFRANFANKRNLRDIEDKNINNFKNDYVHKSEVLLIKQSYDEEITELVNKLFDQDKKEQSFDQLKQIAASVKRSAQFFTEQLGVMLKNPHYCKKYDIFRTWQSYFEETIKKFIVKTARYGELLGLRDDSG